MRGCKRFLDRVGGLTEIASGRGVTPELEVSFHKTVKKVSLDIEDMKYNTAIAAMMALLNEIYEVGHITLDELETFILILNPFAPHITEEIWEQIGGKGLLSLHAWPEYDEAKTVDASVEIAVQISGKLKGTVRIAADAAAEKAIAAAKADEKIAALLEGKKIVKEIYVPGKIVNIVAK
jgi:leucyl-tRNA synthetase